MRKLVRVIVAVPVVVAAGVVSGAPGASAGIEVPPGSAASPATTGYTILIQPFDAERSLELFDTTTTAETSETTAAGGEAATAQPAQGEGAQEEGDGSVAPTQAVNCIGQLATVDLTNGVVTPLPAPPSADACVGDLAFAPDGTLYGALVAERETGPVGELVRFDTTTGAATVVGVIGPFNSVVGANEIPIGGLEFDGQGRLLVVLVQDSEFPTIDPACVGSDEVASCLYRIDDPNAPGAVTLIGRAAGAGAATSVLDALAVSSLGATCSTMYSSGIVQQVNAPPTDRVTTIDTATAAVTTLGVPRDLRFVAGLAADRSGTIWAIELVTGVGMLGGHELVTLNPAGGTPIDTLVALLTIPDELQAVNALAIEPLACAQPQPIVLQPTFTG